jgi:hypothetical protein
MSVRDKDKSSAGERLRGLVDRFQKQGNHAKAALYAAQLAGPPIPVLLSYLWGWFLELHSARGTNGFGAGPLSYPDFAAWAKLTGRRVHRWELQALKLLDNEWLRTQSEAAKEK